MRRAGRQEEFFQGDFDLDMVDLRWVMVKIPRMNFDISQLLEQWDYEPGQVVVRKFKSKDGTDKIQLRVDLGLLQMNAHGRPDGKRPFGQESLFEHHAARLQKYRKANGGSEVGFHLKAEECAKLQQEAIQYHHRYICLFQLEEYGAVVRDTERNMEVFDFVQLYTSEELAWSLQQFRPQLLMMRTRAKASAALASGKHREAVHYIENGVEEIREFCREHSRHDLEENGGEIASLEAWLEQIRARRPLSEREKLQSALDEALRREDYETAAQVRDALRNLKSS